jgi:4-amino-4-deoxy-L-arabinose transferase-like glycosyltransferase
MMHRFSLRAPSVLALLLLFAFVWLWHLGTASLTAPQDNLEQLLWTHALQWGYYKHPPLPTWLLWPWVQWADGQIWASYLWGAAVSLLALLVFWHLLAQMRGQHYALVALLAVLCITYYNGRLYYYNHNTVLMLAVCLSAWACWRAFETHRLRWWAALGLALGAGALSKYQIVIAVICVLVFFLQQGAWRVAVHRQGLLTAGCVALLVFSPHVLWLQANDFQPLAYAKETSLGLNLDAAQRIKQSLRWLADMLLNRALPAWLMLAAVVWMVARHRSKAQSMEHTVPAEPAARAFLWVWGFVPLLFTVFVGLISGAELQLQWGTAFLLFAVPAMMELIPVVWRNVNVKRALCVFVLIQATLLLASHLSSFKGPAALRDKHWRSFDSAKLAQRIAPTAVEQLRGGIKVVIGPSNLATALAMQLPSRPLVLVDGRYDISPWVSEDLVKRCGAVSIVKKTSAAFPNDVTPLGEEFPGLGWKIVRPIVFDSSCKNPDQKPTKL